MYEGGERLNLPYIADANTSSSPPYGCTKCHVTLDERGARHSTFAAFLPADLVESRKEHLTICTGTEVTKIDIKQDEHGVARAEGVYLRSASVRSKTTYVRAKCEIILCSGPFGNPRILQLRYAQDIHFVFYVSLNMSLQWSRDRKSVV